MLFSKHYCYIFVILHLSGFAIWIVSKMYVWKELNEKISF